MVQVQLLFCIKVFIIVLLIKCIKLTKICTKSVQFFCSWVSKETNFLLSSKTDTKALRKKKNYNCLINGIR